MTSQSHIRTYATFPPFVSTYVDAVAQKPQREDVSLSTLAFQSHMRSAGSPNPIWPQKVQETDQ